MSHIAEYCSKTEPRVPRAIATSQKRGSPRISSERGLTGFMARYMNVLVSYLNLLYAAPDCPNKAIEHIGTRYSSQKWTLSEFVHLFK